MPRGRPWDYLSEGQYGQQRQQVAGLPAGPRQPMAPNSGAPPYRAPQGTAPPVTQPEPESTGPSVGAQAAAGLTTLAGGVMMLIPGAQGAGAATIAAAPLITAADSLARGGGAKAAGQGMAAAGNAMGAYAAHRPKAPPAPETPTLPAGDDRQSMYGGSPEEMRRRAAMRRQMAAQQGPWSA